MSRNKAIRRLPVAQAGQVLMVEVPEDISLEEARNIAQRVRKDTGFGCVIFAAGARPVGVCNIRPWKRPL